MDEQQAVLKDDLFKSIAVTAEQWLPIREVAPGGDMKVYVIIILVDVFYFHPFVIN